MATAQERQMQLDSALAAIKVQLPNLVNSQSVRTPKSDERVKLNGFAEINRARESWDYRVHNVIVEFWKSVDRANTEPADEDYRIIHKRMEAFMDWLHDPDTRIGIPSMQVWWGGGATANVSEINIGEGQSVRSGVLGTVTFGICRKVPVN